MSHISIGSAVGSGFELIGRKPLTVLAWGLARVAFGAAVALLYVPALLGMIGPMMQAVQSAHASGAAPSEAVNQVMMAHMATVQGIGYLAQIAGLFVAAILYCAVARSIVHPQRAAFAYLRLGAVEFFVAVITFAAGIAFAIAVVICAIPFVIAVAIMAFNKMAAAAVIVGALGVVLLLAAIIYVLLRFAFIVPMMVDDGQFHLFDAWSLTKGHVGALFVIGLCLALIDIVGGLVVGAVVLALGLAALGVSAGGLQNLQAFFSLPPATVVAHLAPWLAVVAVLAIPLEGCVMAIFVAPWARAYRDVAPPAAAAVAASSAPLPPADPPAAPTPPEPPMQPTPTPA